MLHHHDESGKAYVSGGDKGSDTPASRPAFAKRRISAASAYAWRYLPLRAASTPSARTAGPCAPPRTTACPSIQTTP